MTRSIAAIRTGTLVLALTGCSSRSARREPAPPPAPAPAPAADTDGDGLADKDDTCPDDAEVKNRHEDDDGCPDRIRVPLVSHFVTMSPVVLFETDSDEPDALPARHPWWREVAASDATVVCLGYAREDERDGATLSFSRATTVAKRLVSLGVKADRLHVCGDVRSPPADDLSGGREVRCYANAAPDPACPQLGL